MEPLIILGIIIMLSALLAQAFARQRQPTVIHHVYHELPERHSGPGCLVPLIIVGGGLLVVLMAAA
jgi:hypothetical protein